MTENILNSIFPLVYPIWFAGSNHLVAIDEGSDHTMTVWDTQTNHGKKLAEVKCSNKETVVAAEFHPLDPELIGILILYKTLFNFINILKSSSTTTV